MSFKAQIASFLGIAVADVEKAIENDTKVTINGTLFTDSELEANNEKIKTAAETQTKMAVLKDISTKIGIDVEKTDDLSTAIAAKFSDEDSKKELESLKTKISEYDGTIETLNSEIGGLKKQNIKFLKNEKLGGIIPDGYSVSKEDIRDLYALKSNVGVDESGELFLQNADGTPKTDKKNKVVRPTTEDVTTFLDSRGFAKKVVDEGGKQNPPTPPRNPNSKFSGINSLADIENYAKENNIDSRSQEFRDLTTEIFTENPDIKL